MNEVGHLLRALFGRTRSRLTGALFRLPIPRLVRPHLYGCFLNGDARDLQDPDLTAYPTFSHFFARSYRPQARPVAEGPGIMVSPCDGRIVTIEKLPAGTELPQWVTQVKSATYDLHRFLALTQPVFRTEDVKVEIQAETRADLSVDVSEGEKIWHHVVIYLAPMDYHHFHAPDRIRITRRKHVWGETMPVFTSLASSFNNLFALNERVILEGMWTYGRFYLGAVAAYNVANIALTKEPDFCTNKSYDEHDAVGQVDEGVYYTVLSTPLPSAETVASLVEEDIVGEEVIKRTCVRGVDYERSEEIGEFKLGSTVVLVFEAPADFQWLLEEGAEIKMGQALGRIPSC